MTRSLLVIGLGLLAGACATRGGAVPQPFPRPGRDAAAARSVPAGRISANTYAITATALGLRGTPFAPAGTSPAGFDCSGFTWYVFRQHGVTLPRVAKDQYRIGHQIDPDEIAPGDLLFFSTVAPGASHVALAIGGDEFVHAPAERGQVRVERLGSSYWSRRFLGARRIVDATQ
ncbi:MAG: C40 family peptidase [Acidobacteria bacterium]|nr:C40 family peptidase [Acidobacteriota bacterium]